MRYRDTMSRPLAGGTRRDARWESGGWVNPQTGQGSLLDRHTRTQWTPPQDLPKFVVDGLMQYSGILRRLCWRPPYDCTREGFKLTTESEQQSAAIMRRFRKLTKIDGKFVSGLKITARAFQWARAYGGSLVVGLFDDGRHYREPLDLPSLRSVRGYRVLTRHEAHVVRWDERSLSSTLGQPEMWSVTIAGRASFMVHASRVIQVQGLALPEDVTVHRQGWGGSAIDLVYLAWRNWASTLEYLPELMTVLTQGVFKQKGLAAQMLAKGPDFVVKRYETLRKAMGVLGEIAIDAEYEDYEIKQRGVNGAADLLDPLVEAMLCETDLPRILFKNETIGGLNTGENSGEIRGYYDWCSGEQENDYEPVVDQLIEWTCAAKDGPTQGAVPAREIEWLPLWQPTTAEKDAHETARATRRQIDVLANVVSTNEARHDPDIERLYGPLDPAAPAGQTALDLAANGPPQDAAPSNLPEPGDTMSPQELAARFAIPTGAINRLWRSGVIGHWGIAPHVRVSAREVSDHTHHPAAE